MTDPVGLSWLITVRWTTLLAGAGAVLAGRSSFGIGSPLTPALGLLVLCGLSNVWLAWRVRSGRNAVSMTVAGALVCADVLMLTWLLLNTGGVLNPASVFYLVQIVLAALVLGRVWTWIVTGLCVAGYAGLFLTPTTALQAAQLMHPEIALHMRGMWAAFAVTALIIAILVTRLAIAVEHRDQALAELRDRSARASRLASLVTFATGAAHELGTPLATIAVAARELERSLDAAGSEVGLADARLIRAEIDRCRRLLDDLARRGGEDVGEAPEPSSVSAVIVAATAKLAPAERSRVASGRVTDTAVVWPIDVIARALCNVLQNGLQASLPADDILIESSVRPDGQVAIAIVDEGTGMTPDELARAGEPFFTTKPAGTGTGLGLFVTRSSIEQLGGTFALVSAPGRGTTATITLPRDVLS